MSEKLRLIEERKVLAAFAFDTRQEIGKRDRWTCQGLENSQCTLASGTPASLRSGYFVHAAHYIDLHKGYEDRNIRNGRILCVAHHASEEVQRGNVEGAKWLLQKFGIYTNDYVKDMRIHQVHLTIEDVVRLMSLEGVPFRKGRSVLDLVDIYSLPRLPAELG